MQVEPARLPAFDPLRLASFTHGDLALERELLDLYFRTAGAYLAQLETAVEDSRAWRKVAHALKGASLNVGAVAVGELARAAEAGPPSPDTVATLKGEFTALKTLIGHRPI